MKRTKALGLAASLTLAVAGLVSIPTAAQASAPCYYTDGHAPWETQATVGTIKPCADVQVRIDVYNNYGFAGGADGPISSNTSTVTVAPSYAPGTYTTHSFRYKPKGGSWSAWLPC